MRTKSKIAVFGIASASVLAASASFAATQAITGGEAIFTLDSEVLESLYLDSSWNDGTGTHESTMTVRDSDSGSEVTDDGAILSLRGRSVYLSPTDAEGNEVEDFADVLAFSYSSSDESDAAGVTDEMRDINYVSTGNPNEYYDYENPSDVYTLTDDQIALLNEGELRLCCTHQIGSLTIDTAALTVDGVIDGIDERDINFDGVIDENDDFYLFDLVATDDEDVYDLAITDVLASYLNLGFSEYGFADATAFLEDWGGDVSEGLGLVGGVVVGTVSYAYTTSPVPVPASLPLLAGGLGLMGYIRSRRNRAAA